MISNALKWKAKPERRGRKRKTTIRMDLRIARLAKAQPMISSRMIKTVSSYLPQAVRQTTPKILNSSHSAGASIMIWACFSYYGAGPVYHIPGIMDQFAYIKILEEVMLPYTEEEMPLKLLFQQDNDPNHTSKRAKSWFQSNKIEVME
ncbi:hypothetical protein NFI96_013009 [Prochilodus magdalenae]|nr:hypothetical protein NFI96_013009 [Prochilodus magdalenae]